MIIRTLIDLSFANYITTVRDLLLVIFGTIFSRHFYRRFLEQVYTAYSLRPEVDRTLLFFSDVIFPRFPDSLAGRLVENIPADCGRRAK